MIAMIFIKWFMVYPPGVTPPSIISNMINFALSGGSIGVESPLWGDKLSQESL